MYRLALPGRASPRRAPLPAPVQQLGGFPRILIVAAWRLELAPYLSHECAALRAYRRVLGDHTLQVFVPVPAIRMDFEHLAAVEAHKLGFMPRRSDPHHPPPLPLSLSLRL